MRIDTKYSIGQKVWRIAIRTMQGRLVDREASGRYWMPKHATVKKIDVKKTAKEQFEYYTFSIGLHNDAEEVFADRAACKAECDRRNGAE